MSPFRIYVRCFVANRACLVGASLLLFGLMNLGLYLYGINHIQQQFDTIFAPILVGYGILVLAHFGLDTYHTYIRSVDHINKFNEVETLNIKFNGKYCNRVGFRLALRDTNFRPPPAA